MKAIQHARWDLQPEKDIQESAIDHLEQGNILFFPELCFQLTEVEKSYLTPSIGDPKKKNISYNIHKDTLSGCVREQEGLKKMIRRYSESSKNFIEMLFPHYKSGLIQGKTSFRPFEISSRKTSYRKDDTRLHVDSFPSNPTGGTRILRVFTNINHEGKPRVWKTGESFESVLDNMLSRVRPPLPGSAFLLKLFGITKSLRTPYDHYMLNIHNAMKKDIHYQNTVFQQEVMFPAGSSWIVFTDQVSHAVLPKKGQHLLEQTFHIPVTLMKYEERSPLRSLEKRLNRKLSFF